MGPLSQPEPGLGVDRSVPHPSSCHQMDVCTVRVLMLIQGAQEKTRERRESKAREVRTWFWVSPCTTCVTLDNFLPSLCFCKRGWHTHII